MRSKLHFSFIILPYVTVISKTNFELIFFSSDLHDVLILFQKLLWFRTNIFTYFLKFDFKCFKVKYNSFYFYYIKLLKSFDNLGHKIRKFKLNVKIFKQNVKTLSQKNDKCY